MPDCSKKFRPNLLIFTDLDGTLLDHYTYDFSPALPALDIIQSLKIPLIFVSSKTRSEIEFLRKRLSIDSPFIAENGGGIFLPADFILPEKYSYGRIDGYKVLLVGRPIDEVLEKSRRLKEKFNFKGFSEMPVNEIASVTGLPLEQAILASKREFDEPVILSSIDEKESFCKEALNLGLDCVHGGRFIHIFLGGDKGKAVKILHSIYQELNDPFVSIALGDSPNDISMLKAVDRAVLMQSRDGTCIEGFINLNLIMANGSGPKAWNDVMLNILKDFYGL
ncbi:MAG TPA: HAD-IIB family hydrolase [Desulfatiglandales bacterium]|nr:HAD-IIB family hydrolase [Desulfatiglandales bacterium]